MTTNAESISRFCDELRAVPQFSELADQFHAGLTEMDRKADKDDKDSPDFAQAFDGLKWIWEQPRPIGERLGKMCAFMGLEGHPVICDLEEFTGW